jgi:hypothetical protein
MSVLQFAWTHLSLTLIVASVMVAGTTTVRGWLAKLRRPRLRLLTEESVVEESGLQDRTRFAITAISAVLISAGLSVVPIGGVDLAGHLVAYSGELSFATIFFLVVMLGGKLASGGQRGDLRSWHGAQWAWAIGGLALYWVALSGRGPDLYSFGYGDSLAWIALAISAAAAIAQRWMVAALLVGIVLAWQFRLSGATNLVDYAIDPFIFVGSAVQTSARLCGTCLRAGTKWLGGRKLASETIVVVSEAA